MKEDLILVWLSVSLSRHFLTGLQKRQPLHEYGFIDPRSMLLRIKDQNQGSGSRSQLATLTRSHEWMRPGPDPSSQRNQHSNHSAPDAPTSTT